MAGEKSPGKPTTRRYTDSEKAQAVRLVRELRRANSILKSASAFFAAELDRPHR